MTEIPDLPEMTWGDVDALLNNDSNGDASSDSGASSSYFGDSGYFDSSSDNGVERIDSPADGVLRDFEGAARVEIEIENDPYYIEAVKEKERLDQEEAEAEREYNELAAQLKALEDQRKLLEQQAALVRQQEEKLKSARWELGRTKRQKSQEALQAAKQIEIVKQAIEVKVGQQELIASFEETAKDKTWFKGRADGHKILPHQWEGATMLATAGRAILGDQMGLGKTITSIAALDLIQAKRTLIITPAEVTSNFLREIRMWAPHRIVADMHGMSKAERNALLDMVTMLDSFTIVVNYEAWRKDFALVERLIDMMFDTVLLDEAHTIKEVRTQTFKKVFEIIDTVNVCPKDKSLLTKVDGMINRTCPKCQWSGEHFYAYDDNGVEIKDYKQKERMVRSVKNVWFLTGTPILNNPADIFPLLHIIDKDVFWQRQAFLNEYCQMDFKGNWVFRPGGLKSLTLKLSGRFLARTLQDANIELPPQTPIIHEVELDPAVHYDQIKVIQQLAKHGEIVLDSGRVISPLAFIALLTRQRQANVWPGGIILKDEDGNVVFRVSEEVNQSAKIDKAVELIEEFTARGERVAVFSQFTQALKETAARVAAKGISVVEYHGETTQSVREEVKRNWDKSVGEEKKWDVIVTHYKSGGQGLNLTNATHTIILDQEWNPGKRDQAYARTRRLGQDEATFVHVLNVNNTVDTWVQGLIDSKEEMIEGFTTDTRDMQQSYLEALRGGKFSG